MIHTPPAERQMAYDELDEHLNVVHCWDEYAFESGDMVYLVLAHEAIHEDDAKVATA